MSTQSNFAEQSSFIRSSVSGLGFWNLLSESGKTRQDCLVKTNTINSKRAFIFAQRSNSTIYDFAFVFKPLIGCQRKKEDNCISKEKVPVGRQAGSHMTCMSQGHQSCIARVARNPSNFFLAGVERAWVSAACIKDTGELILCLF